MSRPDTPATAAGAPTTVALRRTADPHPASMGTATTRRTTVARPPAADTRRAAEGRG